MPPQLTYSGNSYMSLSTALLAPAFPGRGLRCWLRLVLVINGSLGAIILPQLAWPWLIYPAAVWMVSLPASMVLLAVTLRADARSGTPKRREGSSLLARSSPERAVP